MTRDRQFIEQYREVFGQPFAVRVKPVSDCSSAGFDVTLIPEMDATGLHMYSRRVYRDGEQLTDVENPWVKEDNVRRVVLVRDMGGGVYSLVDLTEDRIDQFEIVEVSSRNIPEQYQE